MKIVVLLAEDDEPYEPGEEPVLIAASVTGDFEALKTKADEWAGQGLVWKMPDPKYASKDEVLLPYSGNFRKGDEHTEWYCTFRIVELIDSVVDTTAVSALIDEARAALQGKS